MKRWMVILATLGIMQGQEYELPHWAEEDLDDLESGELVPGSSILGQIAYDLLFSEKDEPIELDPSVRELPEDEAAEFYQWENSLNPEWIDQYFRERSEGYLVDPQKLLTMQEERDRRGFLEYHALDTGIRFYFYLFDSEQELPAGESAQRVADEHFSEGELAAIVFYHLERPVRSQIAYTRSVRDLIPEENLALPGKAAIEEAMEKSDAISQIESFSIQLSTKLARLERMMGGGGGAPDLAIQELLSREETTTWGQLRKDPVKFYSVVFGGGMIPVIIVVIFGRYYADRKREYLFPDAQGSPLMGAPHAAGVGGVISYSSVSLPPSSQKEEVPNYLQRM